MLDFSAMSKLGEKLNALVENYEARTQEMENRLQALNNKLDSALIILETLRDERNSHD